MIYCRSTKKEEILIAHAHTGSMPILSDGVDLGLVDSYYQHTDNKNKFIQQECLSINRLVPGLPMHRHI